ncbi:pyridoxal-phosphate dependent enzyme [Sedimenticola sp.]|uniref:pyridoxal-phosphate dependent enzyme n=1 Tax=Sedimenticola sp. TaxID=1940285 RepID=UPI003D117414
MSFPEPLQQLIGDRLDRELNWKSRCHPLVGYLPQRPSTPLFIKREDELNANVVGTKQRKYLSLLPALEHSGNRRIILIGSAHSNNVLGLTQLLRNRNYDVRALVKMPGNKALTGNHLLLSLLLPGDCIHYISHRDWPDVEQIARQEANRWAVRGTPAAVIPEGGYSEAVLPGILTLAADLQHNCTALKLQFRDIWTDSGTGVSAIGLLLGMRLLGMTQPRVHITQIAGDPDAFQQRYRQFESWLVRQLGSPLPSSSPEVRFIKPATAASYGSVNKTILHATGHIARETGLLMDPVYSVKHFYTVKCEMERHMPTGPQLILYNGGTLGLCGFQSQLASLQTIV